MSCQHSEDVCQHCLEKVHTTTEEEEDSPPLPTAEGKRNRILLDFLFLATGGVLWYWHSKNFFNLSIHCFDSILETISRPTE